MIRASDSDEGYGSQELRKLLTFEVRECSTDVIVHRAVHEVNADSANEFNKIVLAKRVNIATYIATHFDTPVHVSESLSDVELD